MAGSTAKRPATAERRRTLFHEAAAVVDGDYAAKLTLREVAGRIATSPRQLQRAFAEAGETSFTNYLRKVRMDHAAHLLERGRPVHEVARAVGYRQAGPFAKAFRRHHGCPPSSFRRAAAAPLAA